MILIEKKKLIGYYFSFSFLNKWNKFFCILQLIIMKKCIGFYVWGHIGNISGSIMSSRESTGVAGEVWNSGKSSLSHLNNAHVEVFGLKTELQGYVKLSLHYLWNIKGTYRINSAWESFSVKASEDSKDSFDSLVFKMDTSSVFVIVLVSIVTITYDFAFNTGLKILIPIKICYFCNEISFESNFSK